MCDYSQLSDHNYSELLMKNEAANAPIMFEEFVKVVIRPDIYCACTFVMQFTKLIVFFSFSHEKIEGMARFFFLNFIIHVVLVNPLTFNSQDLIVNSPLWLLYISL